MESVSTVGAMCTNDPVEIVKLVSKPKVRRGLANDPSNEQCNYDDNSNITESGLYTSRINVFRQQKKQIEEDVAKIIQEASREEPPIPDPIHPGNQQEIVDVETDPQNTVNNDEDYVSLSPPPQIKRHIPPRKLNRSLKKMLTNMQEISKSFLQEKARKLAKGEHQDSDLCVDFEGNTEDGIICLDDTCAVPYIITVKVNWRGTIFRYDMQTTDKFSQLVEFLAGQSEVNPSQVLLTFKDRIMRPNDSPASVGLSVTDILDFSVFSQGISCESPTSSELSHLNSNSIRLHIQTSNCREKAEISIGKDDKMSKLMLKYAEKCGKLVSHLVFRFDGDIVDPKSTPTELDLEDGCCIDVTET